MKRYPQCNDCFYFKEKGRKGFCKRYFQGRFLEDTMIFGVCKRYEPKEV